MPEVEAPRDGTRGAGGIVDSRLFFRVAGALHIPLYRLTGGLVGHRFMRITMLLLTATGAKSGLPRTLALQYRRDGDNLVVVASKGGARRHPLWYRNLLANPECQVQVGPRRIRCRARTATAQERPRLWALMNERYRTYSSYQRSTDRELPLVILSPLKP
jgi:deazaflavin-dependent oxidoreductase (nitroreductase family)